MATAVCPCQHCNQKIEFDRESAGATVACPACGMETALFVPPPVAVPQAPPAQKPAPTARAIKKTEFAGAGAAVQAVGLLLCIGSVFIFWPAMVVGILLLVIGGRMAIKHICSNCGNRLDSKLVKLCPACHANLQG